MLNYIEHRDILDNIKKIDENTNNLFIRLEKLITFDSMYLTDENTVLKFIDDFYTDKCKYDEEYYFHTCYRHSIRVRDNVRTIVEYHESTGFRKYSREEKLILEIAALYHDVGKMFKKKHHNYWSVVIFNYLIENMEIKDIRLTDKMVKEINECILYHNHKTKYRDKISVLVKIIRDADRMDEMCGNSLLELATSYIINEKSFDDEPNLNHLDYTQSDMIINTRNDKVTKEMMEEELNMKINYELYLQLLNKANEQYDKISNYHRFKNKYRIII